MTGTTPSGSGLTGAPVSPGLAAGVVATMRTPVGEPAAAALAPADVEAAAERIATSSAAVRDELMRRAGIAKGEGAQVLTATAAMAADPMLVGDATRRVREQGLCAERAVWDAAEAVAAQLETLGPPLSERARDVRDVRDRIIADLTGQPAPGVPDPGSPFVLVAVDLAPADTALLDPETVLALVTSEGGPTSHTAILARSLGIPAVVAVAGAASLVDGQVVLVDGTAGTVTVDPDEAAVAAVQARPKRAARVFDGVGQTADGVRVQLLANVADPDAARAAVAAGAEGVGLFRTEFCFLGRTSEPTVAEQIEAYRGVLAAFAGTKVVIRTLDAGADKPLPFVTADSEPNPALGVRGLRTATAYPGVLDRQLEAIAAATAAEQAEVWVMAPMVATPDEARDFVAACRAHGITTAGVMVEIPAAALRSAAIFEHADFASLGTNDLVQYTMAADRMLGDLAELSTPWQPAVLDLIAATCHGARPHGRPVGVCGEAAADPVLAPVLVGLGVTSLSMTPRALADVGAVLAALDHAECVRLAEVALGHSTAREARDAVRDQLRPVLDSLGL
ncbi:phosphoenolpyruvate--protein phosphotransferase [Xylanimonas allomyrinae]|uniref:Phosphoenolpyruvate-protein phosphotransferase n=1 Tax=Xylanimonas allomyrinae TaxID=2509459 RepID=A0A4P6EMF5_9MICO|nr:phosphoenolpyruvate--protein phosphotransferase [Xylanimonas allomyrinae]QAY63605.1 phosphoenolpyruvate--protein phosphotransferase [Xylanimonas allomyrinae]